MGKETTEISEEVLNFLRSYNFPGNVRELENIIERGVALSRGSTLTMSSLPDDLKGLCLKTYRRKEGKFPSLEDQEKTYIRWVLDEVGGNKSKAAKILGIDRVSLWRKLKKFDLEDNESLH
jgi:transcriptional regulator with PAS, ATPase and Fis domain